MLNDEYWPRDYCFRDKDILDDTLKKIQEDSSFTSVYSTLRDNVPRLFKEVIAMDSRLNECSFLLQNHASKLFDCSRMISKTNSYAKLEQYKAFLRDQCRQRKIMLSDEVETEKNIEGCDFSGFKNNELPQLPRHLDAKQIFLFILRAHNFEERVLKIWRTHFLSNASIALLHDTFWWWFLHKFKPDRKDQDCLFDRIAENYVTLFMSVPLHRKDAFFQVYPDCLAQAIYAAFQESFPESSSLFNDDFKEDLGNTIFLWLSGLKPQKGFWTHWRLKELCTTTFHGSRKMTAKSVKERITVSQEHIATTTDFHILKNPRAYATFVLKGESTLSRLATKSHYKSFGPEFHRVLFDFRGQSPLISYFLKVHETVDISGTPKQKKSRLTKILQELKKKQNENQKLFKIMRIRTTKQQKRTLGRFNSLITVTSAAVDRRVQQSPPSTPAAPTYSDVIKEAKKQFSKNRKDFGMIKQKINEEIKRLRLRQEKIDKELDRFAPRLQAKASKYPQEVKNEFANFLHKLTCAHWTLRKTVSTDVCSLDTENDCVPDVCSLDTENDCVHRRVLTGH
ncbi:protein FAM227B [Nannospalax galili]|uniref:protein FAM227B n=1 Tax=Nannospalax galili TaxID=1026970 RepID=UPI0004ED135B|nr:protein FAM227B [Nannospalax galili]